MHSIIKAASLFLLLTTATATPVQLLQTRDQGSCALIPCAPSLCCSQYKYYGTGPEYCQAGSCAGVVGGTYAPGLCCSEWGFCGTGAGFCKAPTPNPNPTPTPPPAPAGHVKQWDQCGGIGYPGSTVCVAPYKCVANSQWWSQCQQMGGMRGGVGYEGRGLMGERWVGKEWEQEARGYRGVLKN